jgi:hypothetical protein
MRLLHRRPPAARISYCEACGRVCDDRCRHEEVRERTAVSALRQLGPRL